MDSQLLKLENLLIKCYELKAHAQAIGEYEAHTAFDAVVEQVKDSIKWHKASNLEVSSTVKEAVE